MEEEVCFPRGGRHSSGNNSIHATEVSSQRKVAKSEKRKRPHSDDDFLFGAKQSSPLMKTDKKKKKVKSSDFESNRSENAIIPSSTSVLPLGGGAVLPPTSGPISKPALIETISFQKLGKGTKLLGIIREVTPEYALVSLPNMWTGYMCRDTNKEIPMNHIVTAGMVLPVVVIKATVETVSKSSLKEKSLSSVGPVLKKRIELSISPAHLNNGWTANTLYENMSIRGRIKSIEDHGCIVDISVSGIGGNACFLKFDNIEGGYEIISQEENDTTKQGNEKARPFAINIGRIYDFTIKALPSRTTTPTTTGIIQLSLETASTRSQHLTSTVSSQSTVLTLRTLNPGMLVSAVVEHFARNGLCVSFLGNIFRGAIESMHLGGFFSDDVAKCLKSIRRTKNIKRHDWWKDVFVGKYRNVVARIIAVDPATKIIRLTLLPHILKLSPPSTSYQLQVGAIFENSSVIRLDSGVGALLALKEESDGSEHEADATTVKTVFTPLQSDRIYQLASSVRCAYVHISKALDSDETSGRARTPEVLFNKRFAVGTRIPLVRILNNSSWFDNVASCGTAESIISSVALSYGDLKPGAIYKSVPIIAVLPGGSLMVQLGASGIKGLIPFNHFEHTEALVKSRKAIHRNKVCTDKFKVGSNIDVRCLSVDTELKMCTLTAKKSLLLSDIDNPIVDYQSIVVGRVATGFISRVSEQGLCVTFFNNVYGSVSARRLADEQGIQDPTSDFHVGDVIQVRILKCYNKDTTLCDSNEERDVSAMTSNLFRMDLSLTISPNDVITSDEVTNTLRINVGSVLPRNTVKVVELIDSQPHSSGEAVIPGYAIVRVKSKDIMSQLNRNVGETKSFYCKVPFEHIRDTFESDVASSSESLNALARGDFTIGCKIAHESIVLSYDHASKMPILSLRPKLTELGKQIASDLFNKPGMVLLPSKETSLFMGAYVCGYCIRLDSRFGAFIRFLDNLTGLIPKLKGGLKVGLYNTVLCQVAAIDVVAGKAPKLLLKKVDVNTLSAKIETSPRISFKPGDTLGDVRVEDINFARATVSLVDPIKFRGLKIKARIHVTMASPLKGGMQDMIMPLVRAQKQETVNEGGVSDVPKITKYHPFSTWAVGNLLEKVRCVFVNIRDDVIYLELTNRNVTNNQQLPLFVENAEELSNDDIVSGIVTNVSKHNRGLWVQLCPGLTGFIPGLELSTNVKVLNNLTDYYKIGGRINCRIMEKASKVSTKYKQIVRLSAISCAECQSHDLSGSVKVSKPHRGDLVLGRINLSLTVQRSPALMLELRGGFIGRCDVTELKDIDDWENMPLGRAMSSGESLKVSKLDIVDEDDDMSELDEEVKAFSGSNCVKDYHHGQYVSCRVLQNTSSIIEVSLRNSRIEGDMEDDRVPEINELVHAYVVTTNRKGCFLRLSVSVEGRTLLKDLSDSFLHDPTAMYPPGRLVVGRVRAVREPKSATKTKRYGIAVTKVVDLNMRESVILEDEKTVRFEDVKEGEKYRGIITRVETYGVFVRLDNSDISGLAHLSECSDDYVTSLSSLYEPGDLVKALVLRKDNDLKRIGLSLKASHFEDDSDVSASVHDDERSSDIDVPLDDRSKETLEDVELEDTSSFQAKDDWGHSSSNEDSSDHVLQTTNDWMSDDDLGGIGQVMDTDVGFDWGTSDIRSSTQVSTDSTESENDSDYSTQTESDDNDARQNRNPRRKSTLKQQEEKEIARKERRIATGAADQNPETIFDFERLLANNPDSSENWIRFMAYHLSLADVDSARSIANRAIDRIEFRREGEKLNVWTALLTLELKYGTNESFRETMERACKLNNPKHVYLRVCELLERETEVVRDPEVNQKNDSVTSRADEMFAKMVKKFKSKKTVWIAYFRFLLRTNRQNEAHEISKRALASLISYKHIETMSKFAQLEYEYGSNERARTIFAGLLEKFPKRLDLLFVLIDKEIKHGDVEHARKSFERTLRTRGSDSKVKFNDKQMKSFFKKWYKLEEMHGDELSRQHVKNEARRYVENSVRL